MAEEQKKDERAEGGILPLFYTKPTPLDAQKHKNLALKEKFDFGFAKNVNAIPVNLIEMPQASHFYPIAFSPDGNATPVVITGLRDNENLFVDEKKEWLEDTYIPAYVRRYPFIFSETKDSDQLSLCVDMTKVVIEKDGKQKFFDDNGKASKLSENAMEFCKSYHAAAQQTIAFSKALAESSLLIDRQAEIVIGNGDKINFTGFRIIDEEKFIKLDDDTFLEWRKNGWIPFVYAHLFSGGQWQRLVRLLNERMENEK